MGTDDGHIRADRYAEVAGPADPAADLSLGVTHAPYRRILDPMVADGFGLVLAGHTHGGQLRVPGVGALVTNCDLPRRQARGLSTWSSGGRRAWLHVSAGPRHLAVRAGAVRLPAGGHPADAGARRPVAAGLR